MIDADKTGQDVLRAIVCLLALAVLILLRAA